MARFRLRAVLGVSILWAATAFAGGPISPEKVPGALREWTDWVLHGREEALCPFLQDTDQRRCLWPSRLRLVLDDRSGRFTQEWRVFREAWVPLPGDERRWPLDVSVGGRPAAVALRDGVPSVLLEPGLHSVSGSFEWDALPELLTVPSETGLVALTVRGQPVPFPTRDPQGQLWVQKRAEEGGESRLDVVVHRMVTDEVPLLLRSRIELRVAGRSREVLLGRAVGEGFVPMSLASPLPARIEPDGRLRVQVRPGTWRIELVARHRGPVEALGLAAAEGPWDDEEAWVFEARPALRLVTIEGVPAIDPQQTELPPEWRSLPAYLMKPGSTMRLVETRRGDAEPAPDQLALERVWWLDFDGGGFTIRDVITGTASRSWRLEMPPPTELGRVAIDGRDQFITRLGDDGAAGVEIRQTALRLEADSRLEDHVGRMRATGWASDFRQVSGELRLPPGWRLLHAIGVDDVTTSWVGDWTLLDLFVVLVTALAFGRIFGAGWGAVALAALVLAYPEPGAPGVHWLLLLAGIALAGALPEGRFLRLVRFYTFAVFVVLVVVAVPFAVGQVRHGLWPQLERPFAAVRAMGAVGGAVPLPAPAAPPQEVDRVGRLADEVEEAVSSFRQYAAPAAKSVAEPPARYRYEIDPNAKVTTGPGVPRWTWSSIGLRWRGPVERTQEVRLFLLSPGWNLLLALLRVALLAALVAAVALRLGRLRGPADLPPAAVTAGLLFLAASFTAAAPARADFPSNELLEELRTRLLEAPECFPHCASIPRLRLEASADVLRLRVEIDAAAATAVPLPGSVRSWSPEIARIDGEPAPALARGPDGLLWIEVSKGRHQVILEGKLPPGDSIEIPLPLRPHRVEAAATGWTIAGLGEDGLAEPNLQLVRIDRDRSRDGERLQPGELPPFVRVERTIRLGLSREIDTVVSRMTPTGSAIVLEVPLLEGESVTTADFRVENGKALVSLGPGAIETRWHSILEERESIALAAPEEVAWVEVWRLEASPVWHVETKGIPVVHEQASGGPRTREWRPWPGERVAVALTRPAGVPGPTLTIDRTQLDVSPGLRATDSTLLLEIRSSRGGEHPIVLPEGAVVQSVAIDGRVQPIRPEGRTVRVPIAPRSQTATLVWREPRGIGSRFVTPEIDAGAPSVNADVNVAMPRDRWTLFVGGARLGPAVLFWSTLVVVLLVAIALGRSGWTPLRTHHWFLLGLGLTQVDVKVAAVVAGWLLALGWRRRRGAALGADGFNLLQVVLGAWTVVALAALVAALEQGLLGLPDMQIAGNGSNAWSLRWYHDRAGERLPQVWAISAPLWVYRLAMLAWALWLARALLGWIRWGWESFREGGLWRPGAGRWRLPGRRKAAPPATS